MRHVMDVSGDNSDVTLSVINIGGMTKRIRKSDRKEQWIILQEVRAVTGSTGIAKERGVIDGK